MEEIEAVRIMLEFELDRLVALQAAVEGHLRRGDDEMPMDSEEQASYLSNDEVLEHLDALERDEIEEIRDALHRIDEGTYGLCERCGERIPSERLLALPATPCCVDCADR